MCKVFIYYLLFLNCLFGQSFAQNFDSVLEQYKADKDLKHASFGFCVIEANSGKIIKEYNSDLALIPASTLKIITTSAALGILGNNYTYKTNYYLQYNAESIEKASQIKLMVEGSGDPSFNSNYFYNNDSLFFSPLLQKLRSKNVKQLSSNISITNNCFDNEIPSQWIWGDIGNYFGAGANGLSYKDNKFSILYSSSSVNTTATITAITPNYFKDKMQITSSVKSFGSGDEAYVYGDPNGYDREIKGTIPPNKTNYEVEAQMPQPQEYLKFELTQQLIKNNLVDNVTKTQNDWNTSSIKTEKIHIHISPILEKLVYYTNTKSNNHYAESLLKTIGAQQSRKQGTTENGIEAVKKFWQNRGVDVSGINMVDGSGLSRANTITTKTQAVILSKIYRDSTLYNSFNKSLPIAGRNGSMTNLCNGTFAENNMRAKTGYINRARGYCGYVKTKKGKELAFSILFNNYDCSAKEMKSKIEKFLVSLTDL